LCLNDREIDIVEEGFDLAARIGELKDSSLIARRLCPIRFVTVAGTEYLARHGTPQTPDDLVGHQGLRYTNKPRHRVWRYTGKDGKQYVPDVPDRLVANWPIMVKY
jgi:DNA-binding transcriptional LysR family regulator